MQIVIFKSKKNKSTSYKISGAYFLISIVFLVLFFTFLLSSSFYYKGYVFGYNDLIEDRMDDIAKYEKEINLIKIENKNKMDFFSRKLI